MKYLLLLPALAACTPQMTTDYASQGMQAQLRQSQAMAAAQGQSHSETTRETSAPIIINCIQIGRDAADCFHRTVPDNGAEIKQFLDR